MFKTTHKQNGFSLIEMFVTVSIFAIISTVIVVRNAQFDDETLLHNLAYDVALSIRQAQQYGVNVRGSGEAFDAAYGIHFDNSEKTYQFFRDLDDNGFYDEGELVETYTLGRGATIGPLCDITDSKGGPCTELKTLDIVFRRPDPDAVINNGEIGLARVELISARATGVRYVFIQSTGQISIQRPLDNEEETGQIEL